jgi:polyketide synthase PksN
MTKRRHLISIRTAVPDDAATLAAIDADSWPAPLATTEEQWRDRLAVFPEGQYVVEYDGTPAVVAAAQRINEKFLNAGPITHARLTDVGSFRRSHDPQGEIYQLVAVGASAAVNGLGLGRKLVDRQIEFARSLPGIKRIIGLTRPARFYRHPELSIEDYVNLRSKTGRRYDPVLEFHLGGGAQFVSTHADFRPDDTEARGYGVMIEYPV